MEIRLNLGGVVHLSTVDWEGRSATVVFLRGCPLRCPHCQNRELQEGHTPARLSFVDGDLMARWSRPRQSRRPSDQATLGQFLQEQVDVSKPPSGSLISSLVFSGGEPLMQPRAVRSLARQARKLGLEVGLETCGFYPEPLQQIIGQGLVDRVFLDLKAAPREEEYARAAGARGVLLRVLQSLEVCLAGGVSTEVRVTVFPDIPSAEEVLEIARLVSSRLESHPAGRLHSLVLQQGLPRDEDFTPLPVEELRSLADRIRGLPVQVREAGRSGHKIDL
ncbi:MAG: radical SAM protein [Methanosarcinales archaeon]|nr:radical SAM protein [Methanosarcinales archaeon]